MTEVVKEIERVKKLIDEVTEERRKILDESCLEKALKDYSGAFAVSKLQFRRSFKKYLKKQIIDKDLLKWVKSFKYKCWQYYKLRNNITEYPSEKWNELSIYLSVLNRYYNDYELDKAKKELCHYTDCYNKLKTEKECKECSAVNPLDASYCNKCGTWLDYINVVVRWSENNGGEKHSKDKYLSEPKDEDWSWSE